MKKLFGPGLAVACGLLSVSAYSRVAFLQNESEILEIPRSQIKTYIQTGTLEQNLKSVKPVKPGAVSDEELVAIPEKYLTPDLKKKQDDAKARIKAQDEARKKGLLAKPLAIRSAEVVKIQSKKSKKIVSLKIDEAVWVPPTAATDDAILAPQRKLPDVELIESVNVETSGQVKKEIHPGETREVTELFKNGTTKDADKTPSLEAYGYYIQRDYATAVTLALGTLSDRKSTADQKLMAKYLAAHSLFQAGFYASALPLLTDLVASKLRRSAIGMAAQALEKTRDDGAANQILAKLSLSQIPDDYRPLFSFHLGRILLNTGAREAALAAFNRVPSTHSRYPEAQYFVGVIQSSEIGGHIDAEDWDKKDTPIFEARTHFDQALVSARTANSADLVDLIHLSLARLAYQSKQYNQAIYFYNEVNPNSPFSRESLFESAWSLYRIGEFNRSLGMMHALGSEYFEARDLPELWVLRSLNYLKLCRFDEARKASTTFEFKFRDLIPEFEKTNQTLRSLSFTEPSQIQNSPLQEWIKNIFLSDPVIQKDISQENLLKQEEGRLEVLRHNPRIKDTELRDSATDALKKQIDRKIQAIAGALKPYLEGRLSDVVAEYKTQHERLDLLKFEIYSQATKYPKALERPEAKKLIAQKEFLPGVFTKGQEILWKFNGEYWSDEIRGYDYFIPTECKSDDG